MFTPNLCLVVVRSNVGKKHQKARTKHENAPGIMEGGGSGLFSITLRYDGYSLFQFVKAVNPMVSKKHNN